MDVDLTHVQYRLVIVGPDDEVLGEVPLDGFDLDMPMHRLALAESVQLGMGTVHAKACAALPEPVEE